VALTAVERNFVEFELGGLEEKPGTGTHLSVRLKTEENQGSYLRAKFHLSNA
jgi:hypothetical protein